MNKRLILTSLSSAILATVACAATVEGNLHSLDNKASTLMVAHGTSFTTFKFRTGVPVTLNGQRSSLDELLIGVPVRVISHETGVATQIFATAVAPKPKPGSPAFIAANKPFRQSTTPEELREFLVGTWWAFDGVQANAFVFMPDGSFKHRERTVQYTVTGPRRVTIIWSSTTRIDCELSADGKQLKELNGMRSTFTRLSL